MHSHRKKNILINLWEVSTVYLTQLERAVLEIADENMFSTIRVRTRQIRVTMRLT